MELLDKKIKRNQSIAWRTIEEEALLVDPKDGLIYPLNAAGTRIWELIDGTKTCREILVIIHDEFEVEESSLQKDAVEFIEELVSKGLVIPV
ncbi:MAG: PqqD family protein [Candidatus Omnitrophota bacterium]|jgi:hypothetical protein